MVEVYEKTTVELSYPSVARFTGHVQLKGLSERTVESYVCMIRQLTAWGKRDPAELTEEQVRDYFLHLVRERKYAPASLRQARASLGCFFIDLHHPLSSRHGKPRPSARNPDTREAFEPSELVQPCAAANRSACHGSCYF